MRERCIADECLSTTGFSYTLSLINGKYKMTILYTLMEFGVVRFNEIKKYIGRISYKTLSSTLKELEREFPQALHVYESCTNFAFLRMEKAEGAHAYLLGQSIAVRKFPGYLRITAGTLQENAAVLEALARFLRDAGKE